MLLCEHSCLKQYHQLFRAKGTSWGKFSVCYWQITTIYGMYTEIDLLTGQLKKEIKYMYIGTPQQK